MSMLLAMLSGAAFAGLGVFYKASDHCKCRPAAFLFVFTLAAGCLSLPLALAEPTAWHDARLWALGGTSGILLVPAGTMLLLRANRLGPASVVWTVLSLSLLVPILAAPLLFHERRIWLDWPILALFVVMIGFFRSGVSSAGAARVERLVAFMLAVTLMFLSNGCSLAFLKLKQLTFGSASSAGYLAISFLAGSMVMGVWHLLSSPERAIRKAEWGIGLGASVTSAVGNYLGLLAMRLPSAVVFPVTQGVALLGGLLLLILIYREPVNRYTTIAFLLGLAVLLLAAVRQSL
jgi:hypothetical protein